MTPARFFARLGRAHLTEYHLSYCTDHSSWAVVASDGAEPIGYLAGTSDPAGWFPTAQIRSRVPDPGVIVKGELVLRLFRERGWIWQNIKVPDHVHLHTGYHSGRYTPS